MTDKIIDNVFNPQEDTITVTDAASLMGVCERTIKRRIADGTLKAKKIGRKYYINKSDFNAMFK